MYVPKFRSRRTSGRRQSDRKSALEGVAEESPQPEDHTKRASAPVRLSPDKDSVEKSPDESVRLLSDEAPSASFEFERDRPVRSLSERGRGRLQRQDEHRPARSLSQSGRGRLQRQDESIV